MSSFVYFDYQAGSLTRRRRRPSILLLMIVVFVVAYLLLVARRRRTCDERDHGHGSRGPPANRLGRRGRAPLSVAGVGFWILAIVIGALLLLPISSCFKVSVSTLAEATAHHPS